MKQLKIDIIDAIVSESKHNKIISLREVVEKLGAVHISTTDCRDIVKAVETALPTYRSVRMMKTPNDSIFQSLCFVQNDVEFDDEDDCRKKIVRIDPDGSRDLTLATDYNTDNYTVSELEDIARTWEEEDNDGTRYIVEEY